MMRTNGDETKKEIVWLDVVRLVAMFMVVQCHVGDSFIYGSEHLPNAATYQWWGAAWGSFLRPCVPLFVMMTGFLLLPVRETAGVFYRKRIFRVLWPFLFWSVLYCMIPWLVGVFGGTPAFVNILFPYATNVTLALREGLLQVARIPLNFNAYTTHMWYVYLLIGLYLMLPVFSAWVERATAQAKWVFLAIWGVTLCVPYVEYVTGGLLWGQCPWHTFPALCYFSGFIGYLLLGHVLGHMKMLSWRRTLAIAVPLLVVGYCATFIGFRTMQQLPEVAEADLERFWMYCSPNVAAMTVAVFLLCKRVTITHVGVARWLADINRCGFGVYLSHYVIVGLTYYVISFVAMPVGMRSPVVALVAYVVTYGLIRAIRAIPGGRWFVG